MPTYRRAVILLLFVCPRLFAQQPAVCAVAERDTSVAMATITSSPAASWGGRVTYRSFEPREYILAAYPGAHVEVLLPDELVTLLQPEEVRALVTRLDLLYETYRHLTGREPNGEGRLRIAFVNPFSGVMAHAYRGMKGIEVRPDSFESPPFRYPLGGDAPYWVLSHEMAHNFDFVSPLLHLGNEGVHAWTELVQHLALVYERSGSIAPAERLDRALLDLTSVPEWLRDESYSFEKCTADGATCGAARINAMFGYMGMRALQVHGVRRTARLLRTMSNWESQNGATPNRFAGADFYVEALSEAVEQDVSCYADQWKWFVSASTRARLAARYGPNLYCSDADGDGVTPIGGDVDDHDPRVHPGARELLDGRDNDCDGLIDNLQARDAEDPLVGRDQYVSLPLSIEGSVTGAQPDTFRLTVTSPVTVIVDFDRRGWPNNVRLSRVTDAAPLPDDVRLMGGEKRRGWLLDRGEYRFSVVGTGEYTLRARSARPLEAWGRVMAADAQRMTVVTEAPDALEQRPTHVVFWVEGVGIVATVPWAPVVAFDWHGADAAGAPFRYRARLTAGETPQTDWIAPAPRAVVSPRRRAVQP